MGPIDADWALQILLLAPPLLLSLTIHEYAHARTALAFGDPTARMQGRVSLNPLRHLDPLGTAALLLTQFIGWAKPVPVNPANLHPRRTGDIAVSLAGPASNLLLAGLAAVVLRLAMPWMVNAPVASLIARAAPTAMIMLMVLVGANLALAFFNLLPLFPLDGHHIARELLPGRLQDRFMSWQLRYGRMVLLGLLIAPLVFGRVAGGRAGIDPLGWYLRSVVNPLMKWLVGFGLSGL